MITEQYLGQIEALFPISLSFQQSDLDYNNFNSHSLDKNIFSLVLQRQLERNGVECEVSWGTVRGIIFIKDKIYRVTTQENSNVMNLTKPQIVTFIITE